MQRVANVVVEADDRQLQLADDAVLVIARIADHRAAIGAAQQIVVALTRLAGIVAPGQQLGPRERARLFVEIGLRFGPDAIDAVEIERRCADIGDFARIVDHAVEGGARVERDVVIDELAEEHHADGYGIGPVVLGFAIHRPALTADRLERVDGDVGGTELGEQPPEAVVALVAGLVPAPAIGAHPFEGLHSVMFMAGHWRSPVCYVLQTRPYAVVIDGSH